MKELQNEADVSVLVRKFYEKVLHDELLAPFFQHAYDHHWSNHLEVMDRFWNNILFYTGGYLGNPLETHKVLNHIKALQPHHFERWQMLFSNTVDELYYGEKALLAKSRAHSIAVVMQIKVIDEQENDPDEPVY